MSKLPRFPKPKNRDGYYFTPTVDGKTKWVPLGTDKQAALKKYHLHFLVFLLMGFSIMSGEITYKRSIRFRTGHFLL